MSYLFLGLRHEVTDVRGTEASADEVCAVGATMYLASPPHSRIAFVLDDHGIDDDMVPGYN